MKKISRKIGAFLCMMGVLLWCMAGVLVVSAEEQTGTLAVWCIKDDVILQNMHWQIYRVGHRTADDYEFEGKFAEYYVTLGNRDVSPKDWDAETAKSVADSLRVMAVIVDKLPPRAEGYTNERGLIEFDNLEDGLYLVCGDIHTQDKNTYIPNGIFFEMNGQEEAYLNAFPKLIEKTKGASNASYTVRKEWKNGENQAWDTSVTITVEIYQDTALFDTVELNERNDWSHTWTGSDEYEWSVHEKVIPPNYTVSYSSNLTQYLIVNTFEPGHNSSHTTDIQTTTTPRITDDWGRDSNTTTSVTGTTDSNVSTTSGRDTGTNDTNITTSTSNTGTNDTNTTTQPTGTGDRATTNPRESQTTDTQLTTSQTPRVSRNSASETTTRTTTGTITHTTSGMTTPAQTTATDAPKLPQTGQLWWPVPPLACGGILMMGLGMKLGKKDDDE